MSNTIEVQHYFDAAHQLPDTEWLVTKACARLHGHTYAVKITAKTKKLNGAGMVIDFKAIKEVVDVLDHRYINDIFKDYGYEKAPTAENIAIFLAKEVAKLGVKVTKVSVCEGYKGIERASWATYEPQAVAMEKLVNNHEELPRSQNVLRRVGRSIVNSLSGYMDTPHYMPMSPGMGMAYYYMEKSRLEREEAAREAETGVTDDKPREVQRNTRTTV